MRQSAVRHLDADLLRAACGPTGEDAADLTTLLEIALVVGGLVGGLLSDYVLSRTGSRWAARNGVALFSLVCACAFYLAAYPIENVYLATLVFGIGAFLFTFIRVAPTR